MSREGDIAPLEIHLHDSEPDEGNLELISAIAHFHRTGHRLDEGHTVNFGRPWRKGSLCTHGLLSLPYLDGPALKWLGPPDDQSSVRCLWLIPITGAELAFKKAHGIEALEERFEAAEYNYTDPMRPSVV